MIELKEILMGVTHNFDGIQDTEAFNKCTALVN